MANPPYRAFFLVFLTLFLNQASWANDTPKDLFMRAYALQINLMETFEYGISEKSIINRLSETDLTSKAQLLSKLEGLIKEAILQSKSPTVKTLLNHTLDHMKGKINDLEDSRAAFLSTLEVYRNSYGNEKVQVQIASIKNVYDLAQKANETAAKKDRFLPASLVGNIFTGDMESSYLLAALSEFGHLGVPLNPSATLFFLLGATTNDFNEAIGQLILYFGAGIGLTSPQLYAANDILKEGLKKEKPSKEYDPKPMTSLEVVQKWQRHYDPLSNKETLQNFGLSSFLLKETPLLTSEVCQTLLDASASQRKKALFHQLDKKYGIPVPEDSTASSSSNSLEISPVEEKTQPLDTSTSGKDKLRRRVKIRRKKSTQE